MWYLLLSSIRLLSHQLLRHIRLLITQLLLIRWLLSIQLLFTQLLLTIRLLFIQLLLIRWLLSIQLLDIVWLIITILLLLGIASLPTQLLLDISSILLRQLSPDLLMIRVILVSQSTTIQQYSVVTLHFPCSFLFLIVFDLFINNCFELCYFVHLLLLEYLDGSPSVAHLLLDTFYIIQDHFDEWLANPIEWLHLQIVQQSIHIGRMVLSVEHRMDR